MHEFGHILGAADYYSTGDGANNTLMTYDMMCIDDGDHDGFTKWSYGWFDEEDIAFVDRSFGDTTVTLAPIETDLGDGKKIAVISPEIDRSNGFTDEYFIVEYDSGIRNNAGIFQKYSYQPGFRIFHVNANCSFEDGPDIAYANTNVFTGKNLIHNVKNELDDPVSWNSEKMFYREGDSLTPEGFPNSGLSSPMIYNGRFTGISFTDFVTGDNPSFKVSFSDEAVTFPDPEFTLTYNSLTSDIDILLESDMPLTQKKSIDDDFELPYLLDGNGKKLPLRVKWLSFQQFRLTKDDPYPYVEPDSEYTLVIPEGYFLTGYEQRVGEFRQTFTTDHFIALTEIGRYDETDGVRFSNNFAVTESTYGRIELDIAAREGVFREFNLNSEELSSTQFELPGQLDPDVDIVSCGVYTLFDGNFALCVYGSEESYFTKIDKYGSSLSDTFTLSNAAVGDYAEDIMHIRFEPFKGGLYAPLHSFDDHSHILLKIDFENEPSFTDFNDWETITSLAEDVYTRLTYDYADARQHLYVYDRSDAQTADIVINNTVMGVFLKDGNLKVLLKAVRYDSAGDLEVNFRLESYAPDGTMTESEDVTAGAGHLTQRLRFDHFYPTDSGYFLVAYDKAVKETTVVVCDGDWSRLGEFTIDEFSELTLPGECGLITTYQYFPDDGETAYLISRFNIGDFDIIPAKKLLGDANLDGSVDITDATAIQRYDVKMIGLSDTAKSLADVDRDGEVCVIDATWIQRRELKMKAPDGIGEELSV